MELHARFVDISFQLKLGQIEKDYTNNPKQFMDKLADQVHTAQVCVLPTYGYETTACSAADMMKEIQSFCDHNAEIAQAWKSIHGTLRIEASGSFNLLQLSYWKKDTARKPAEIKPLNNMKRDYISLTVLDEEKTVQITRVVTVGLEHTPEVAEITLPKEATVSDLKANLKKIHGIPARVRLLVHSQDGGLDNFPGADTDEPPDVVFLKGVASLNNCPLSRNQTVLLEEDMLAAARELHRLYETSEFQEQVQTWQKAKPSEAIARAKTFRSAINQTRMQVLPKFDFKVNAQGSFPEWEVAVEQFQRFPVFADICRRNKVLLGMASPGQARKMFRASVGKVQLAKTLFDKNRCKWTEFEILTAEQALVAKRMEANEVFELLYLRIYEENRDALWRGGDIEGHEMPTREAVARKFLEPPGTLLVRCTNRTHPTEPVVGGAALFPIFTRTSVCNCLGFGKGFQVKGAASPADEIENKDGAICPSLIEIGYINALAALQGSRVGFALLERVQDIAETEKWQGLALHSINIENTLNFWTKNGFRSYGAGKEEQFKFACLQTCGVVVEKANFEQQLPHRPGCVLFVKFLRMAE